MKIRFKLTAIMALLSLASVVAVSVVLLLRSQKNITDLAYDYTDMAGKSSAHQIEGFFEEYWHIVETSARIMEEQENIIPQNRRAFIDDFLQSLLREKEELIGAWCLWEPNALDNSDNEHRNEPGSNSEGRFIPYWHRNGNILSVEPLTDYDVPGDGDYYLLPKKNGVTTLLEPYMYEVGGTSILITSISTPIYSKDRKILGIMGIDISVDEIQKISEANKPFDSAITAVFSNSGIVSAHFDTSRVGKNLKETEAEMVGLYMDDFLKALKGGEKFSYNIFIAETEQDLRILLNPITVAESPSPWSYAVGVPQNVILSPVHDMLRITVIIAVIILVIVICTAIFLSMSISKPIVNVANTLKDISEGEGDLTRTIAVSTKDEIGDLALYFNRTLEKIKKLVISVKKEAGTLSIIGNDLAGNMTETAAAVNQITANIQSIKGRVINQSANVTETNATMEEVVGNINKLDNLVEKQTTNVSQASSAIEEMVANINSVTTTLINNSANVKILQEASAVGRSDLSTVVQDIHEIARESEGLQAINSVMEDIASQTNLLSMNAAIEAAHAKEAGKGFAVVADEIRKLAESSGKQSKIIGAVLKKIAESISKITQSAENVLTKFEAIDLSVKVVSEQEENIRNAMEEQGEGSKQILQGISEVNEITRNVKSGSDEMLESSKEVIEESASLEKITQEIASGMNEMATGANQINVAVNEVNELTNRNREGIDTLMYEVSRFKVE